MEGWMIKSGREGVGDLMVFLPAADRSTEVGWGDQNFINPSGR